MQDAAQARLLLQAIGWLVIGLTAQFVLGLLLEAIVWTYALATGGFTTTGLHLLDSLIYGWGMIQMCIGLPFFIIGVCLAFAKGRLFGVLVRSIIR